MKQHVYNTALYLRLSRDDEEYGEGLQPYAGGDPESEPDTDHFGL